MIYNFVLDVDNPELDDDLIDALYEASADDLGVTTGGGSSYVEFGREAQSLAEAIGSGLRDVESTGLTVVAVRQLDLLSLKEIAEQAGYSYEYLRLLARGKRGPGNFPPAVSPRAKSSWQFYRWDEVALWISEQLGAEVDTERAQVIALANALLQARRLARVTEHADVLQKVLAA